MTYKSKKPQSKITTIFFNPHKRLLHVTATGKEPVTCEDNACSVSVPVRDISYVKICTTQAACMEAVPTE